MADDDMRCTFLAARVIHDLTRQCPAAVLQLSNEPMFWRKVVDALDKCLNDRVAKEMARTIYNLTSKDGQDMVESLKRESISNSRLVTVSRNHNLF